MICNESKYNSQWNTLKLEQLGSFARGISKHRPRNDPKLFEGGGYPFIQTGEIKEATLYIENHKQEYNEFGLQQSKLWDAGTLCITIAANIAETAILAYPMCFPDSVVGFIADTNKSSEVFMYYVFEYIKKFIQNVAIGSIQDNINLNYLTSLSFKIPPKEYQDKISGSLLKIDKKILCNNNFIKELESLAKTLYDFWFLQFNFPNTEGKPYKISGGKMVWNDEIKQEIPNDWRIVSLGDLIIENPKSTVQVNQAKPLTSSFAKFPFFTSGNSILVSDKNIVDGRNSYLNTGGCAGLQFYVGKAAYSTDTWCITGTNNLADFLYLSLSAIEKELDAKFFQGTGLKHLQKALLKNRKICLPPNNIIGNFNELIIPIFDMISDKIRENRELTDLRDWLLPLLMNGQVGFHD